jgi:non-ribosomal peptide synthetase component F
LPVRVQVNGEDGVSEWLRGLQRGQAEARQYEYSPLAEIQRWSEVERGVGLFETLVVFENFPVDESLGEGDGGLELRNYKYSDPPQYDLTLVIVPGAELEMRLMYSSNRFDVAVVERVLHHFQYLVEGIARNEQWRILDTEMLVDDHGIAESVPGLQSTYRDDQFMFELG